MKYYIRYTDDPNADLERGYSYHPVSKENDGCIWDENRNSWAKPLQGLCAYILNAETLEAAIKEAEKHRQNNYHAQFEIDNYCILTGEYVKNHGDGVIINDVKIIFIKKV